MADQSLIDALTAYVTAGAHSVGGANAAFIAECAETAEALVSHEVGAAVVPAAVLLRAQLECGSELYQRRAAPQGVTQFASDQGIQVASVSRDPMSGARLVLRPFLPGGFA